jgi:Transposase IS200 like
MRFRRWSVSSRARARSIWPRENGEKKRNFVGQHFWARRYFVSTVGRDEAVIRAATFPFAQRSPLRGFLPFDGSAPRSFTYQADQETNRDDDQRHPITSVFNQSKLHRAAVAIVYSHQLRRPYAWNIRESCNCSPGTEIRVHHQISA